MSACSLAAEAAAWVRDTMGISLYEWLKQLYVKYGFYQEGLVSVVRTGKEGAELIQRMMVDYRANPPKEILGSLVVKINDIQTLSRSMSAPERRRIWSRIRATYFSGIPRTAPVSVSVRRVRSPRSSSTSG